MPSPDQVDELRARVDDATALLEDIAADRGLLAYLDSERRVRLLTAAGRTARPDPLAKRRFSRVKQRKLHDERRDADERVLARTGIRALRRAPVFPTPSSAAGGPRQLPGGDPRGDDVRDDGRDDDAAGRVRDPRRCYICKQPYHRIHPFYDALCPACADLNWRKRNQTADLRGRVAVITGARVKIGYHAAILLLRAGCRVIVTTRFPRDAAARYARERDFDAWRDRLEIYGLDLRHTPSVEALARHLDRRLPRLDFLLNNACQTVRRPPGFYAHLMDAEQTALDALPAAARPLVADYDALRRGVRDSDALAPSGGAAPGLEHAAALSQLVLTRQDLEGGDHLFPAGQLDADLQQVDLRGRNSWRLTLAEVPTVELLEVHLVNAVAPFVLAARLKPAMLRDGRGDAHIVNVSAMEGQFYRSFKTDKHPHTNMAKAALNMLTRTSAADYVRDGIHMNSVDTGWITDEDPAEIARRKRAEHRFHPPLDVVDGAARICDPIFDGFATGDHMWGQFLKDYAPTDW